MNTSAAIRQCRASDATITVTSQGAALSHQDVVVAQHQHRFLFGCIGFDFIPYVNGEVRAQPVAGGEGRPGSLGEASAASDERLAEYWFALFNFATLPFYWGRFEPVRGCPDTQRIIKTARWFTDHGCLVKGHPLAWHTVSADWLLELSNADILTEQLARITREVTDFAGVIDMWDVINEVVIMPIFEKYDNGITRICRELGRIPLTRMVFEAARQANPRATLLLNDFDLSSAYECLIEGLLEAGVTIDALGLQSHMHQGYLGEEKTLAILERFSRYGLPIHFTETTIVSGHLMPPEIEDLNDYQPSEWPTTPEGEERQADEIVRHYRTLLSHPAVTASTYWGIADGGWLGAPGGFIRADGTPKPSYHALRSLIRDEWWLKPTTMRTDQDGKIRFNGFLGEYQLSVAGQTASFQIAEPGDSAVTVDLPRPV